MKLKAGKLPADQGSRDRIIKELDMNFFVEASAGSGKTTVLINRMAALILSGVKIDRISTITFTKAAANEFYKRFHNKLTALLGTTSGKQHELVDEALKNIDLCFMGTIDSFCSMILKEHPSRAGVPSKVKILQGTEWDRVLLREYKLMLKGDYCEEIRKKALWSSRNFSYAEDTFLQVMRELMNKCSYEFRKEPLPSPEEIQAKLHGHMKMLEELCSFLGGNGIISKMNTSSDKKKYEGMKKAMSIIGELDLSEAKKSTGTYIYDHLGEFASAVPAFNGFKFTLTDDILLALRPAVFPPAIDSVISRNVTAEKFLSGSTDKTKGITFTLELNEYNEIITLFKGLMYAFAMDLCVSVKEQLFERLRRNGELSFNPCLCAVRDMLKKDAACQGSPLIRHITERHRYYLIDEFQDTDPLQYEIFFYLAAGGNAVPEWEKCVPLPGALFIVGDPKQSIYSFKGADAAAFIKVRELFENASGGPEDPRAVLRLTFNFRSTPQLCAYFDQQFKDLLGDSIYSPIRSAGDEADLLEPPSDPRLFHGAWRFIPQLKDDERPDAGCIRHIADIIASITDSEEHLICPDPEKPPRKINYDDIMIITKTKSVTDKYRSELEKRGIPVFVEGSCSFETSRALGALKTLLYAVDSPRDSRAVYPALTGPVFGISESVLAEEGRVRGKIPGRFSSAIREDDLSEAIGDASLRAALEKLRDLGKRAKSMIPSAVICTVSEELELFRVMGSEGMKYYYYALELIRRREADGSLTSLRRAADMLNDMINDNDGIERCLSLSEDEKGVHIANLHKVKGLEKPIVFLALQDNRKGYTLRNSLGVSLVNGEDGKRFPFVFRIQKKLGWNRIDVVVSPPDLPGYNGYLEQAAASALAEQKRQQYVAATRAGCALVICDTEKDACSIEDEEVLVPTIWKALVRNSTLLTPGTELLTLVPEDGKTGFTEEKPEYAESTCSPEKIAAGAKGLHPYVLPHNAAVKLSALGSSEEEDEDSPSAEKPEDETEETAAPLFSGRERGTLVHLCMEYLILSRGAAAADPGLLAERVTDEAGRYFDEDQREESIRMLQTVIGRMTSGGYPQRTAVPGDLLSELFSDRTEEFFCELPFVYTDEVGAMISGVIDLLYRQGDSWHIIDYKTNQDAGDLERDPTYAAQLACYRRAVIDLKGVPEGNVDAHIYHIEV
ncbi:ATP-dependent exoDNAse (exonuclease V) beta subunit (contains helicase and exonuclease domains) [Ruminococcaceae bacterium FB2012]|nr:ATP-dependent exoDNAse (exonuclease V) beta subunit (contains helicase and exonuclease domains) [Ruminococcaceae bacterium FB2012]